MACHNNRQRHNNIIKHSRRRCKRMEELSFGILLEHIILRHSAENSRQNILEKCAARPGLPDGIFSNQKYQFG
jgi:hypothetical protein